MSDPENPQLIANDGTPPVPLATNGLPDQLVNNAIMPTSDISSISLKLPSFMPNNPKAWFCSVEAQFALKKITSQASKYFYVVSSLDSSILDEIDDVLSSPPSQNQYDFLRTILIERFSLNIKERLHLLRDINLVGDEKPSQFLRRMQRLSDEPIADSAFLQHLFLSRLPLDVQKIIETLPSSSSISEKASLADNLVAFRADKSVNLVDIPPPPSLSEDLLISAIRKAFPTPEPFRPSFNPWPGQQYRPRQHIPRPQRHAYPNQYPHPQHFSNSFCYFHSRYGPHARSCRQPCNFQKNASGTM